MALRRTTFDLIQRVSLTSVATPRATTSLTTSWVIGPCILDELHVIIPAGHVGVTGLRVVLQGTPIVPWNDAVHSLTGDNEVVRLTMGIQVSRTLTIITKNSDRVSHTHYLRALWHDVPLVSDTPRQLDLVAAPFVGA